LQAERTRPTGVTIICILTIIGGIAALFLGIVFLAIGPIVNIVSQISVSDLSNNLSNYSESDGLSVNGSDVTDITTMLNEVKYLNSFLGYFLIIGIYLVILAIASFMVSWGLLKGKAWAWIFAIVLNIASIILGIVIILAFGIVEDIQSYGAYLLGFIIYGVVLWYLFRKNVKIYFGRKKIQDP